MNTNTKPTSNEAENSNKSKPLLGDVFIRVFCGVSIEEGLQEIIKQVKNK